MAIYKSPFDAVTTFDEQSSVFEFILSQNKTVQTKLDKPALIDAFTGKEITYKQLIDDSIQLGAGFVNVAGLKPGDCVCLFSPNSIIYPVILFATQCAGLIASTANSSYTVDELLHQLQVSKATVLMAASENLQIAREAAKQAGLNESNIYVLPDTEGKVNAQGLKPWTKLKQGNTKGFKPVKLDRKAITQRPSFLPFSSGTTGKGKGVAISALNVTTCCQQISKTAGLFDRPDTVLGVLPLYHIFGLIVLLMNTLWNGGTVVLLPKFDLEVFCSSAQKYKATMGLVVPPIALGLAKHPIVDKYDLSSIRFILSGAAPLSADLQQALEQRLKGPKIVQGWGMSETTSVGILPELDTYKPGTVGKLLSSVEARLVDENGKDVPAGEPGELWVRGKNIMLGYYGNEKATKETIHKDGWLMTGDVCIRSDDGVYTIVDRTKELIKYKGFQVPPAELEGVLVNCPMVSDAAVIGVWSEEQATELPLAFIVPDAKSANDKDLAKKVADYVASKVAPHKRLRGGVRIVDVIPKSPSGKILRKDLRTKVAQEQQVVATLNVVPCIIAAATSSAPKNELSTWDENLRSRDKDTCRDKMRLTSVLSSLAGLALICSVRAEDVSGTTVVSDSATAPASGGEQHAYESDISRLLHVVVNSLYSDKDVWVRELISNANDAIEKLRLMSLTDPNLLDAAPSLNISIIPDVDNNRIIIRDSGIGMTKEALRANLGTIARSGTTEFLEKLEKGEGANLIGQFGLGFYSSFLVADKVTVASKSNDSPAQYVFESRAKAQEFNIYEDPRGNTLGRGTEITLWLRDDAKEYLDEQRIRSLVERDAEYGASPIYLWTKQAEKIAEVTDEDRTDDDDADKTPVESFHWSLVNDRAPLWMRDPKEISDEEYEDFYKATFKAPDAPLAWTHFKGDAGSTSFRALVYIPSAVPHDFYSKDYVSLQSLKLFVRRVFITSDLGKDYLPRHLNWIKVFIDVDDLPLNVGRDRLQKTRALHQIKSNLVKRIIDTFSSVAEKKPEKYLTLYEKAGTALKIGAIEDTKNREKMLNLLRFDSTAVKDKKLSSLSDVVARRKKGQTQLFYLGGAGQRRSDMEKSPFIEQIVARGYEALFFSDPIDEMLVSSVPNYGGLKFQDVAKEGLQFGDEADTKQDIEALKTQFEPLSKYLETQLNEFVDKVVISDRLVDSPCLVSVGRMGYSGNLERLIASQNQGSGENFMTSFAKSQKKTFEINPRHPLIESLLDKVEDAESGDDNDAEALREASQVLWNTALIKSGFSIPDPNDYFARIETILRRSLGVSESAKANVDVRPAPPVEEGPVRQAPADTPPVDFDSSQFQDWNDLKQKLADAQAGKEQDEADSTLKHDEL
ncbi:hypothetical protein OIO90_004968 [Microbotryomycetes sp. JL221]|nr:hypothetical protein OIO90_004968 [Microbotryomycetes sp. JL221]